MQAHDCIILHQANALSCEGSDFVHSLGEKPRTLKMPNVSLYLFIKTLRLALQKPINVEIDR